MIPTKSYLLSLVLFSLIVSATASALASAPASVPLAPVPRDLVHTFQFKVGQWQVLEAQAKARAWSKTILAKSLGTANMELYDVTFYDLDLDLDHRRNLLTGTVTVVADVVGAELGELELNLRDAMTVSEVRVGATVLNYVHEQDVLTATLDRVYLTGETVAIEVDYEGDPSSRYFTWDTLFGKPMIWTLSESMGSSYWWPCKDLNTDKADSVSMHVTVDNPLYVATIGTLREVTVPEAARSTYHWHESYPIVPYLVSLAVHDYVITEDTYYPVAGDPMPMVYYTFPDYSDDVLGSYGVLKDIMAVFEQVFGPYPFAAEKYGQAHFLGSGAMEHQTCTSISYLSMDPDYYDLLYAHELAHQWFGDLITCADFHHIWLNEGFAKWSEAIWIEHLYGPNDYHAYMNFLANFGPGTVYVENTDSETEVFEYTLTYLKAAWVVHMLRGALGDDDFFAGLDLYRQTYAHSSATTEQFQVVMETASGRDLSAYFQQWIYGEYYPVYAYSYSVAPAGDDNQITLRIEQTQTNTGLFTMPLEVLIETDLADHTFVVENSEQVQFYTFTVAGQIQNLSLDRDNWVLCEKEFTGVSNAHPGKKPDRRLVNVPNPFNPVTDVVFSLPRAMSVELAVYDMRGRLVNHLSRGELPAGDNSVRWDGTDRGGQSVASGTYYAVLRGEELRLVQPMTLVR